MATMDVLERLLEKTEKTPTCWIWHGATLDGYGIIMVEGICRRTHRIAYELLVGPIPDGLVLDHLCRVRHCANPAHLEPVTIKENVLRGYGIGAIYARRSHCKNGHEFTPENTKVGKASRGATYRRCVTCSQIQSRAYKARKRAKRNSHV